MADDVRMRRCGEIVETVADPGEGVVACLHAERRAGWGRPVVAFALVASVVSGLLDRGGDTAWWLVASVAVLLVDASTRSLHLVVTDRRVVVAPTRPLGPKRWWIDAVLPLDAIVDVRVEDGRWGWRLHLDVAEPDGDVDVYGAARDREHADRVVAALRSRTAG